MDTPIHIESTHVKASDGSYKHLYICSCGNEFLTVPRSVRSGKTKSCGCLVAITTSKTFKGVTPSNALDDPTESSFNNVWNSYKQSAKSKNHTFELSKKAFKKLTKSNCHYCGCEPYVERIAPNARGGYLYNGIDRKNNEEGYTAENSLPCCGGCNYLKRDMDYDVFINHCTSIAKKFGRWDGKV